MMRKITKSLMALAMLCIAGTASAQDVETDLTADMFKTWSTTDGNAVVTGDATVDFNVGVEITNGGVLCGTSSVYGFTFADLSEYTKIVFTGTPAEGKSSFTLRVLYNREGASGANGEKNPTITTENPTVELNIADLGLSYFHLVAIKAGWGQTGTVTSVKLIKPADPYAVPKATLKNSLDKGKLQNSFAKTTASWNALQDAISAGETEYANPTSTDALNAAALAIENAIAGLKLQAGYANLTADMFMTHASTDAGAAVTSKPGCAYDINKGTGQPYGDGSVGELNWADLTPYEQFIILTSGETKPRLCMNRLVKDGQQAETQEDSKMLDINPNNAFTWSTEKYQTIDGNKYTIDLTEIVKDYTFARLHAIKKQGWGADVFVTDMLIYAAKSKTEVGAAGYATFSSIMNVDMTGVTAYAAKVNGDKVKLTPVTAVPANNAVIVVAAAGTYNLTNIESADAIADNELKVSNGTVEGDGTIYVLAKKGENTGFYKLETGKKVPAGKAYLVIPAGAPEFIAFEGAEVTGIENVSRETITNNSYYNLAGQRVAQPTKGLYIVNGKKVILK